MRKALLATTAAAAFIGCTTLAMAQNPAEGEAGKSAAPQHGTQQQMKVAPGGGAQHQLKGGPGDGSENDRGAQNPGNTTVGQSNNSTIPERLEPGRDANRGKQDRVGQGTPTKEKDNSGAVQLSQEQRAKIKDVLVKDRTAHIDHANFSVAVGAVVPKSVHITVVPADIVAVVPEYRGFDYIVVGDDILIVNPDTLRIVAVIAA
jgi:Protein of unknown function (DUF1236)